MTRSAVKRPPASTPCPHCGGRMLRPAVQRYPVSSHTYQCERCGTLATWDVRTGELGRPWAVVWGIDGPREKRYLEEEAS